MNIAQCADCQEPTKTPVGFWDGQDKKGKPTFGFIYDCSNTKCLIKQEEIEGLQEERHKKEKARIENLKNGIDIKTMNMKIRKSRMTAMNCSKAIGVSPATFSNYAHEREPIPLMGYLQLIAEAEWRINNREE